MEDMEVENPQPDETITDTTDSKNTMEIGDNVITESEFEDNILNKEIDDNSDSEVDDNDDEDAAEEAEIKILEATLEENPYDYASHLAIIGKLKKIGELDRLRAARENMNSKYPLSSELWLSWIKDEINLATTEAHRDHVIGLCERAVKDYLSVEVWLEYLQFSIGNMGTDPNAANNLRQLFEKALTAVGLHTIKGAIIWEAFREFETVLYQLIDSSKVIEKKKQLDRIGNLFQRQLACPLLDMEKTKEEYETWRKGEGEGTNIDENIVLGGYERAFAKLNSRLPFEEKLVSVTNESELLDAYKAYLLFEKQNGDPGRITVLYERAVADLSLEVFLWDDYTSYLQSNLKIETILNQVFERAVKNVPWCATIWRKWIRCYEKWGKTTREVQKIFENALLSGFATPDDNRDLWITYLEFLRRKFDKCDESEEKKQLEVLRNTFNRACEHLANSFGLNGDPHCVILQYWARTEAIHANDFEKARALWIDILSQGHSTTASSWLEYISLERCYGDTKRLRKLYQKALTSVKDWPEIIAESWINFERDEGNLEQMELCESKTKEKLDKVFEERQKAQSSSSSHEQNSQSKKLGKRKFDDAGGRWKTLGVTPKKLVKPANPSKNNKTEKDHSNLETKIDEKQSRSQKVAPPPGFEMVESENQHSSTKEVDEKTSVFISNLDYTATEDDVRNALKPVGPIVSFKMTRDYKGRSKGYCYVQLSNAEAVERALALDRTPIDGRPMFVSKCDPDRSTRDTAFKYSCNLEKRKLFVRGIPIDMTKDGLADIFKVYGNLKETRLVTYRNGHSKGLAYVEFQDEASAKKALLATDGMKIGDKEISVAISKPPERKRVGEDANPIHSLGSTAGSRSNFGMPKTLLSMVPRSVKPIASNGSSGTSGEKSVQPKNNEDFRNLFLNKK